MKFQPIFALCAGLCLSAGFTHAAPPSRDMVCAIVADLSAVIADETAYPPLLGCPEIGFGTLAGTAAQRSQAGAFIPATGMIELAPDLDLTTAYGQSFLLHELVHAAQYDAGRHLEVPCPAALEAEAYAIQAAFLRRHGMTRTATMTAVMAAQLGVCHPPDY
jgi:hypothetical protein